MAAYLKKPFSHNPLIARKPLIRVRQHPRGLLVAPAILAAAASRHLTGETAALSRVLPVRSQCPKTGKGFARLLDRGAGRLSQIPITPKPNKSLANLSSDRHGGCAV